ncbi:MAG TPA: hypothetical protein VGN67_20845 [Telluribacter sp.]|jgi:hypothetical protein|nr:hypothetical protein [Telluribacter sp.]
MITYQVDIIDPKADRLLKDLADMNLIAIKQTDSDGFMQVIERLRSKAEQPGPPTMEEITQEVVSKINAVLSELEIMQKSS